ncbi:MAG: leucine-rich repeat domain-containing protein, partial [Clostridia bacterium]|nr:leucine-rich repeat domain-containing protein [Clostridia bacterium]
PAVKGSLNVPAGIETIGDRAFYDCELITEIILPDSVKTIGNRAFRYCSSLEKINLPEGIKTIPTEAFSSCNELKEITIPESVTEIGANAFTECKSLETVEIPSGVTIIGELAFDDCFGLKSVKMGDTIEKINLGAFNRCFSLESVTIPESVTEIGTGAFGGCMSLRSVVIPGNVKTIDSYAFAYCYSLSDVVISEGVETIGEAAFSDCFVKNLTLPRSVKTVGKQILNFNEPTYEYSPEWIAYMKAGIEQFRAELEQLTPEEREIRLYEVRHDLKYYEIIFDVFENNDPKNFTTDVWFGGSSADRQAVAIDQKNDMLLNATWHYTLKNNSGVTVEFEDGAFTQDDINLVVEETNDPSVAHAFTMHGVKEENIKHIYNIYIQNGNGEHVQPKGKKVTVRIPIPDDFNLNENYYIYHKKANVEKPERFLKKDIIVENGFFVIEVESFSNFAVVQGGDPEVMINGFVKSVDVDYKTTVNFSATAYDLPDGASIHWYINGKDEGKGEKYTAEKAKATYTVQVKVIGADGETVAESEKETVNVNTGFFAKLIAFFRNLFNLLPVITQE